MQYHQYYLRHSLDYYQEGGGSSGPQSVAAALAYAQVQTTLYSVHNGLVKVSGVQ